jgi:hypothetical protein
MIDLLTYTEYFRNIADKHKHIKAFLKLGTKDLGEAQTAIRNADFQHGDNVLLLENFEIWQQAPNEDQCFNVATGLFSVFQVYDTRQKYDLDVIGVKTLNICRDIEARMWNDYNMKKFISQNIIKGSFEFEPCHAQILNMFGWRVFFDFADYNPIAYNPDNWNN